MKIDKPSKPIPPTSVGETTSRLNSGKSSPSSPSAPASTSVSLGSTAAQLNSMENSMASSPIVDAKKVAEIKLAISQGKFQVNSGVVADKLLESVRTLIKHQV